MMISTQSGGLGVALGEIRGTRVQLDWSLSVIFFLVAAHVGLGVLPAWHPAWGGALSAAVSTVASLLFLASVFAQALAQTVAARCCGISVPSIKLFVFGGVAELSREPESATQEASIALAGPIASAALGILLLASSAVLIGVLGVRSGAPLASADQLGPLTTVLLCGGATSLLFGGLSLLPGLPLDGGRVLRALLRGLLGDYARATRMATQVGRALALLLILTGILMALGLWVPFLGVGPLSGLWVALVGWFLRAAPPVSDQRVRRPLTDVSVSRVMWRHEPPTVHAQTTVRQLVDEVLTPSGESIVLVTDDARRLTGVVRAADVRRVRRESWDTAVVEDLAVPLREVPIAHVSEDAGAAFRKLAQSPMDGVLVTDSRGIVGVMRPADVARWLELERAGTRASPPARAPARGRPRPRAAARRPRTALAGMWRRRSGAAARPRS